MLNQPGILLVGSAVMTTANIRLIVWLFALVGSLGFGLVLKAKILALALRVMALALRFLSLALALMHWS